MIFKFFFHPTPAEVSKGAANNPGHLFQLLFAFNIFILLYAIYLGFLFTEFDVKKMCIYNTILKEFPNRFYDLLTWLL